MPQRNSYKTVRLTEEQYRTVPNKSSEGILRPEDKKLLDQWRTAMKGVDPPEIVSLMAPLGQRGVEKLLDPKAKRTRIENKTREALRRAIAARSSSGAAARTAADSGGDFVVGALWATGIMGEALTRISREAAAAARQTTDPLTLADRTKRNVKDAGEGGDDAATG